MKRQSEFMHWAKTRPRVKYDLALSGVLNLPFPELDVKLSELELHGDNAYGYRPLVEAIAAHRQVAPENVVTISGGTSMANHLAMAVLLEHGDEVLIEKPTYDPLLAIAEYLGAKIKRFPRRFEDGFKIDIVELASLRLDFRRRRNRAENSAIRRYLCRERAERDGATQCDRAKSTSKDRRARESDAGDQSSNVEQLS